MIFKLPFLLINVFFRTPLPCSDGYHLERGGMPLHDAVGINCKKGETTEKSWFRCQVYVLRVYLDDCVCVCVCVCYPTRHDYPFLVEGESPGILL